MAAGQIEPDWPQLDSVVWDESLALAIGSFDRTGEPRYLNRGMRMLLGGEEPARPRVQYFINPSFPALVEAPGQGQIFSGILTLGDGLRINRSLSAQIWREGERILVTAEFDVLELDRLNTELSRSNQEINNLQRQLIGKNHQLEHTLAELRRTQAMLIHAEKMNALGQLVAGVAHEINTPLGYIVGNLAVLEENLESFNANLSGLEEIAKGQGQDAAVRALREENEIDFIVEDLPDLFRSTHDGVMRVKVIVDNLRAFSRLNEAERKQVDLRDSLTSTLAVVEPQLREKGVEVHLELSGLPMVECYPAELNQVFMNLIVNAMQAMDANGRLTITGKSLDNRGVGLMFTDTGSGIPGAIIDRIFDPFFTTKEVGSGTGLGLSIAHEIVTDHHKGRIHVQSTPGGGTTFTLELPIRLEEPLR